MFPQFRKFQSSCNFKGSASCEAASCEAASKSSTIGTSSRTTEPSKSDDHHNNGLAYLIAIVTLGTAFGNMFLAGKIRSVMKVRMPKASWGEQSNTSGGTSQPSGAANPQDRGEHKTYEEYMQNLREKLQRANQQRQRQHIEALVEQDLKNLNLSFAKFNEADIKKAYASLVRLHHPDVLPKDLSKAAMENHKIKFNQITNSYHVLLDRLKRNNDNNSREAYRYY